MNARFKQALEVVRQLRPSVQLQVLFWALTVFALWLLSREVTQRMFGSRDRVLSFEFNPTLFLICLFLVFLGLVIAAYLYRRAHAAPAAVVVLMFPLILSSFGGMLVALNPSSRSLVDREYVPTASGRASKIYVIPYFFKTGDDQLSSSDKEQLNRLLTLFDACVSSEIEVQGFASSTRYPDTADCDSDCQNRKLAQRRARIVSNFINELGQGRFQASYREWDTFEDMRRLRRIRDTTDHDEIIPGLEPLNRRVELTWMQSSCELRIPTIPATADIVPATGSLRPVARLPDQ